MVDLCFDKVGMEANSGQVVVTATGNTSGLGMERETGFEPATPTLARLCSTTELFPHRGYIIDIEVSDSVFAEKKFVRSHNLLCHITIIALFQTGIKDWTFPIQGRRMGARNQRRNVSQCSYKLIDSNIQNSSKKYLKLPGV